MNDFHDRLLDASLKEYSRVAVPENFVAWHPVVRKNWAWWIVPVAAVVAAATVIAILQPPPIPGPPARLRAWMIAPHVEIVPPARKTRKGGRSGDLPHSRYRTLTGAELAHMTFPPDLFALPEEKPITDLQVPEIVVQPLDSANPIPDPKE